MLQVSMRRLLMSHNGRRYVLFAAPGASRRAGAVFAHRGAINKLSFRVLIYRAATTSLVGFKNLSFYTSCYRGRAKTVTRQMKYTVLL